MSDYMTVPGKGRVKVNNSFCDGIFYTSGDNKSPRREDPYERTKRQVYATGNKWAIENFHATHD